MREAAKRKPIDFAPAIVRQHGLVDAHTRPLVSGGKSAGIFQSSTRVDPKDAWKFPSIELRTGNSWPSLVLDCDNDNKIDSLIDCIMSGGLPDPNWMVTRRSNNHTHVVWNLATPVYRGAKARTEPLRYLAHVAEFFALTLNADSGYTGVLTHNPIQDVHKGSMSTRWCRKEPYELAELAATIPKGWKMPAVPRTAEGNNCRLFVMGMKWAGSPKNIHRRVFDYLIAENPFLQKPLPLSEVKGISRSVEKYRRRWIAEGQFSTIGDLKRSAWGREQGLISGQSRRQRNAERDAEIVRARIEGRSFREIARLFHLSVSTVHHVLDRDLSGVR